MRFVRANPQTVEHQHFQITQAFNGCRRNLTQISGVGEVIEAIRDHGKAAVNNFKRSYFEIAADAKRRAVDDRVRHNLWQAAAEMRRLKYVLKNSADVFPGALVCVKAERPMTKGKGPNVIKSENVIGVYMRDQMSKWQISNDKWKIVFSRRRMPNSIFRP